MRLPLALATLILSAPAASEAGRATIDAAPAPIPAVETAAADPAKACREPASHFAEAVSKWRDEPAVPKKLTELPPATGYMAVYRTVDGCEEPMTIVEYRTGSGR